MKLYYLYVYCFDDKFLSHFTFIKLVKFSLNKHTFYCYQSIPEC
jgi:hypothetical protein